jgi:hypothetical protein
LSDLNSSLLARGLTAACLLIAGLAPAQPILAQSCQSPQSRLSCSPQARIEAQVGPFNVTGAVYDEGQRFFRTELSGSMDQTPRTTSSQAASSSASSAGQGVSLSPGETLRVFCRRDDYAFVPAGAAGGLPCDVSRARDATDPGSIAGALFNSTSVPSLRLGMNPRLGMVALPTWFWVEGYNGEIIPLEDRLTLIHHECQRVAARDARGDAVLDAGGAPVTREQCRPVAETLTVEVHAWPRLYRWDFGDSRSQLVACGSRGACPQGLGRAYTDPHTPSPIQHAYVWTSLGAQGAADAYLVRLGIVFGARYRFSHNAQPFSGWQDLPERELSWAASHQVQEAQAVLTRR